jgi:aminoglycoside phosphotransferase (APT) family kinase protein
MENEIKVRLTGFCENIFSSRKNIRIENLVRISTGWENEVFSFIMEYNEAGKENREDLILRIYQGNNTQQKATKEFNGMKKLYGIGYPVPRVIALSLDESIFGRPTVIMEKINGNLMGDIIDDSPYEKKMELVDLFCKMFVQLHSLDWRPFAENPCIYESSNPCTLIDHLLTKADDFISIFKVYEYMPSVNWLKERKLEVQCEKPSVIHFDYHPHNIILRDDGKALVIDWTNIDVSDFRVDLAWTIVLTSTYGNPDARNIIIGHYERISGRKVQDIEYFEVIAALRRLFIISVSITQGADKLGMRPQSVEMMKLSVKHIKNVYSFLLDRTGITIPKIENMLSNLSRPDI